MRLKRFLMLPVLLIALLAFSGCGEAGLDDVAGKWAYKGNENWVWTFDRDLSFSDRHEFEPGNDKGAVMSRNGSFQIASGILIIKTKGAAGDSTVRYKVEIDGDTMTLTDNDGDKDELTRIE